MNIVKKAGTLVLAAALVLGAAPVFAHGDGDKEFDPAKKVEKMKKQLNLTDEQAGKIRAILDAKKAETEAARKQWEERRKKTHDEIAAVLTDEQRAKFEEKAQKMKERKEKKDGSAS